MKLKIIKRFKCFVGGIQHQTSCRVAICGLMLARSTLLPVAESEGEEEMAMWGVIYQGWALMTLVVLAVGLLVCDESNITTLWWILVIMAVVLGFFAMKVTMKGNNKNP